MSKFNVGDVLHSKMANQAFDRTVLQVIEHGDLVWYLVDSDWGAHVLDEKYLLRYCTLVVR